MVQFPKGYKHDAPFDEGFLSVGSIHKIHYERYGNEEGKPVIFLHGGPGGSASYKDTVFFDPAVYHAILFDQRGAGKSTPSGEIRENASQDLVSDIEALRKHFGINRWHVFGGSWGSTLSILYAQTHPESVVSITLRGVFFETKEELEFNTLLTGTWRFHPELYADFIGLLTEDEQKDVMGSYAKRMTCGDRAIELEAAIMYDRWATIMSKLVPKEERKKPTQTWEEEELLRASSRIECHYHAHKAWLRPMQFLEPEYIKKIVHIPCQIVNGRYDLLCPPIIAHMLHKALPNSKLFTIPDAGHSAFVRYSSSELGKVN